MALAGFGYMTFLSPPLAGYCPCSLHRQQKHEGAPFKPSFGLSGVVPTLRADPDFGCESDPVNAPKIARDGFTVMVATHLL